MLKFPLCCSELSLESKILAFAAPLTTYISQTKRKIVLGRSDSIKVSAAKSGNFSLGSIFKSCETCGAKGAIDCPGCKVKIRRTEIFLRGGNVSNVKDSV
ncbi:hypothetical protein EUTSA_v10009125mg [Eutrema salsugineum]|uniref:Uncharacterized protein n=1 Tax=Eutrema salsugineum TaxID=72664 RepID=V4MRY7_EUTSA|nr:hypothetical protein EUTSA_v10009125mg [Eutrema salsugineum]